MKKLILPAVAAMLSMGVYSQNVTRQGMTFVQTSKVRASKDTLVTAYKFKDSKGNSYPIIINKASGRCYVWKKSGKTGKLYKMYMSEAVSRTISNELHITYKPKNK